MSQRCWIHGCQLTWLRWCSFNVSRSCYILFLELFGLTGIPSKSVSAEPHSEQDFECIPCMLQSLAAVLLLIVRVIIHCTGLPVMAVPAQQNGIGCGSTLSSLNWLNLTGTRENNRNNGGLLRDCA